MEARTKDFDETLSADTNKKLEELQNRLMKEKEEALAGLEEETGQLLEKLQQKYDKEHGKLSDRLLNEMVRS